ncbi:RNA polymerase sigma factor [Mechercharimyces sp. CAU 1602]|uniref:RNA polymerase sigma factor n=1 Tax=Mechercharimyces sp. CAU 1602 TaxID=2973933 RepID=UPI0021622D2D|nr:RNA polymerase sigma factor [Mechercharimyces sp. CAU 1602]MCS1350431.1 RNA polymerase sigma factor [Mechercharimyces sp. CAU 1602]
MEEVNRVERAQGDRAALIQLLRDLETPLYQTAFYLMGNEHDARDATQEALLRIYKNIHTFKGESKLETWAQRIVSNICMDTFRRRKKSVPLLEEVEPVDARAWMEMERTDVTQDLQAAINRLPDPQRVIVVLRHVQDYSYQEIANTLDLPLNTVKSHLFRARNQLKEWLSNYNEGGGKHEVR